VLIPFIFLGEPWKMIAHCLYAMKFESHLGIYSGVSFDRSLCSSVLWSTLSNPPLMSRNIVLALRPAACASWTQCVREIPASHVALCGRLPVCLIE